MASSSATYNGQLSSLSSQQQLPLSVIATALAPDWKAISGGLITWIVLRYQGRSPRSVSDGVLTNSQFGSDSSYTRVVSPCDMCFVVILRHLVGWTCPFSCRVSIVIIQGTTVRIESSHSQVQFKETWLWSLSIIYALGGQALVVVMPSLNPAPHIRERRGYHR